MDFETKRAKRYRVMRDLAMRRYSDNIVRAKKELEWAKDDRKHGYRVDHLDCLNYAAHYREEALWWYARYKKKCEQIAELEN